MLYRTKITFLFIIIGLIPIISIGIYFHQNSYQQIIIQVEDMLSTTADLEKQRIDDILLLYKDKINLVGSGINLPSLLSEYNKYKSTEDLEKIMFMLNNSLKLDDDFIFISISNPHKQIIASTDSTIIGNNMSEQFVPDDIDHYEFGFPYQEHPVTNAYLSRTVLLDNKIVGFVYAVIDSDELDRPMIKDYFGETGEYLIAEKMNNGDAIFINSLKFSDDPNARIIIPHDELNIPITQSFLDNDLFFETVDYRGVPVFAVTRGIDNADLGLVAKIDIVEALNPLENIKNSIISVSIILIIIIGIISFSFSKTLINPISKLEILTKEYAEGRYNSKHGLKTNDEFLPLGEAMEDMAGKIKTDKQIIQIQYKELLDKVSVEKELLKSRLELETEKEFNSKKDEFSAMVSHELKTPIFPIKTYCKMLKDPEMLGKLTSKQIDAINEIENMANKLECLTEDILDAQKLDMNKMKFVKDKLKLDKFFQEIKIYTDLLIKGKNISFILDSADLEIYTDRNRLFQVITNLIKNAIKVVPENSGNVQLGVIRQNDDVLFYVKDNGVGIALDEIPNLFKKFYQIDTSLKRKHGGTGLGLVICKGIITGLGGKIWIDSKIDVGTTVYFSIPCYYEETDEAKI